MKTSGYEPEAFMEIAYRSEKAGVGIRMEINPDSDPDPTFWLNLDPDPGKKHFKQ
jgi:hypothetical protein